MKLSNLLNQIKKKQSFLCVGLDADTQRIPKCLQNTKDIIFEFNKHIIDATAEYAVAFKPNVAFYEANGYKGWESLQKTAEYIKENYPEIYLIADAKRGDIGNTSRLYAQTFFELMPFDAVTVVPYMGIDSVMPFLKFPDKQVILLALTSNMGAYDFQKLKDKQNTQFFEHVLKTSQEWADEDKLMYVVGATQAEELQNVRKIAPEHFLLVPGVGAQGGSLESVIKNGINDNGGLLINSSRGIIFTDSSKNFDKTAAQEAEKLRNACRETASDFFAS